MEYGYPEGWLVWLKENRNALPEPWPEEGHRQIAPDSSEYVSRSRVVAADPLEQSFTRQLHIQKWQGGELVAEEEYSLTGQMYLAHEIQLALRLAGFDQITVEGAYTGRAATADDDELMFVAVK
jgi:hypothetical protein